MWAGEKGRWVEKVQSAELMRNEGAEGVQGGAFLAGRRRRKMVSSALEKLERYPSVDVR